MNKFHQLLFCLAILLFFFSKNIYAQKSLTIEFDKIDNKHVVKAIKERGLFKLFQLANLKPTANLSQDSSYYEHIKVYEIAQNIQQTWNAYTTLNIKNVWSGKRIVRYGFVYNAKEQEILYPEQSNQQLEVGQKIFFNIRIMRLVNLVAALEVLEINKEEHSITFSYVEGGNTKGTQKIILEKGNEHTTIAKHITNYRSVKSSKLRDKRLYPFFHTKSINEIHENAIGDKIVD